MKPWRKFRPPMGPISPAQKAPGQRERPEALLDEAGVVVGAAEQVHAAAVAREEEGATDLLPTPPSSTARSSSAASASRTWNCSV